MASEVLYTKAELQRKTLEGLEVMQTWLPEKFVVKGNYLKLQDENGLWTNGWEVLHNPTKPLVDNQYFASRKRNPFASVERQREVSN